MTSDYGHYKSFFDKEAKKEYGFSETTNNNLVFTMYGGILCMTAQNITGTYDTTGETIPFRIKQSV